MLKLLTSYFIFIQLFGILYCGFDMFLFIENGEIIYILLNFPIIAVLYIWNITGLSRSMELANPDKYQKYAPHHPMRKSRLLIGPFSLFSQDFQSDWENFSAKIKLTKWNLIFLGASFILTTFNLVLMVP